MLGSIRVGHVQDLEGLTGCTVFLAPPGTVGSCDVRGGAPGTRETALLKPSFLVSQLDAVVLSGGSAFGLSAADGVSLYLEERGLGFPTPGGPVPIVGAAVLFDLMLGDPKARPGPEDGYRACEAASTEGPEVGCVGAGTGATVGNALGIANATKGGLGYWAWGEGELKVEAVAAVNSFGEVVDHRGEVIAGVRGPEGGFLCTEDLIASSEVFLGGGTNTTLALVATNARLNKEEAYRLAIMSHDGIARAVRPAHMPFDGDTVFVMATGETEAALHVVGAMAEKAVAEAIREGVRHARSRGGVPASCDILKS